MFEWWWHVSNLLKSKKKAPKDSNPDFLLTKKQPKSVALQLFNKNQLLKSYVESLLLYFNNPDIVDEEVLILKVRELLSLLYKMNSNNIRDLLHEMFNPDNLDFKHIINKNIYEDLSLEELAHLCNMSLSSFKRRFAMVFNDTPASYIKNKRLEKAAQLLLISNNRIIDICFDCGFSNVDSFSRAFKQKYGSTPTIYRKKALTWFDGIMSYSVGTRKCDWPNFALSLNYKNYLLCKIQAHWLRSQSH